MTEAELKAEDERVKAEILNTIDFIRRQSKGSVSHALSILLMSYYLLLIGNIDVPDDARFTERKIATDAAAKSALRIVTEEVTESLYKSIWE